MADPDATGEIERIAAVVPGWAGRRVSATPITSGLTNRNYRVEVGGTPYFVRVPGPSTELLAVDRDNEAHNTAAAAEAGVGARVVHRDPASGALVLEWLPGRTMSIAAFAEPGMPARVAASLRRLHAGPRFRDDFDMFRLTERYLGVVDERGFPIPDGFRGALPDVARIERSLAARPYPTVPCHNDLLAENYLDDGEQLRIVDYEYSGNDDPTFELANTCQELAWEEPRMAELAAAYFGRSSRPIIARMRLQAVMSDVGWTLWAAIQASISPIDFDFMGWAEERWARARTNLADPDFGAWLADASADPGV